MKIDQPSAMPTNKVSAAALGGALAAIVAWIVSTYGIDMPPGTEAAFATLIAAGLAYWVREDV
jgi:phosphoserine phosphatase